MLPEPVEHVTVALPAEDPAVTPTPEKSAAG